TYAASDSSRPSPTFQPLRRRRTPISKRRTDDRRNGSSWWLSSLAATAPPSDVHIHSVHRRPRRVMFPIGASLCWFESILPQESIAMSCLGRGTHLGSSELLFTRHVVRGSPVGSHP